MRRTFEELFRAESYPAMSHPSADPAVNAAVARAMGVDAVDAAGADILEIGCGTGHHLLSLAKRWPGASCTGLDISPRGIARARSLARQAGIENVRICEVSVLEFENDGKGFDCIIAHGVYSWVADEVKVGLLDFIGKNLAPDGVAVLSFNVAAGWKARMAVVEKVRAIAVAGDTDEMTALEVFSTVAEEGEKEIAADMLAKGAEVLAFDDFAPDMDAWSLGAVVKLAEASGLKWLGDSVSGEKGSDEGDVREGRTFRSELFCRADAVIADREKLVEGKAIQQRVVPDFPKLDEWRLVCAREALPLVAADLKPCVFTFPQLKLLAKMDGSHSAARLAMEAKEIAPEMDFVAWLRHVTERGMFD
ncbi:MAG: class I SAM-dependent methyltransferase [Luteolibacter sp.]